MKYFNLSHYIFARIDVLVKEAAYNMLLLATPWQGYDLLIFGMPVPYSIRGISFVIMLGFSPNLLQSCGLRRTFITGLKLSGKCVPSCVYPEYTYLLPLLSTNTTFHSKDPVVGSSSPR